MKNEFNNVDKDSVVGKLSSPEPLLPYFKHFKNQGSWPGLSMNHDQQVNDAHEIIYGHRQNLFCPMCTLALYNNVSYYLETVGLYDAKVEAAPEIIIEKPDVFITEEAESEMTDMIRKEIENEIDGTELLDETPMNIPKFESKAVKVMKQFKALNPEWLNTIRKGADEDESKDN